MSVLRLNLMIVGIALAAAGAFAWGLLIPGLTKLHDRHQQIDRKLKDVKQMQLEVGDVSTLYASILDRNKKTSSFYKQLPVERRFGEFLSDITQCIEQSHILDYTIQPKPAREVDSEKLPEELKLTSGTVILPVHISFNASLSQVYSFLGCVDSLMRLSHIDTLHVVNDEHQPGRLKVDIVLETYYRPEKKETDHSGAVGA